MKRKKNHNVIEAKGVIFFCLVLGFGATVRDGFGGGEINLIVWAGAHEVEFGSTVRPAAS
jgi:hypothetical protein